MHNTAQQNGFNFRALVVDDSVTVRRLMDLTLRPLGLELEFADNGEDAIALVRDNTYDIIFLDVIMPGIDGYQVCKAIKNDKRLKSVPVVMLTSRDSAFDKIRGMMAGTDIYLTKPMDRSALLRAINRFLPLDDYTGLLLTA